VREVPISLIGHPDRASSERLTAELRDQRTLADVLTWARAQIPQRSVTEIVTQDEYTHDVVIAFEGQQYLVFDTT